MIAMYVQFRSSQQVRLKRALRRAGLRGGELGRIVMVYVEPDEAYEVAFSSPRGGLKAVLTLGPEDLEAAGEPLPGSGRD